MTLRPRTTMKRLLEAAHARFRRARPGSVLIMVVSLLVLLALIGTAAISTARIDRGSSRAHVGNTQADILLQSLKEITVGRIQDDAYPNRIDSPGTSLEDPGTGDQIYASRLPERLWRFNPDSGDPFPARWIDDNRPPGVDPIVWRYISFPPFANGSPFVYNPPDENTIGKLDNFKLHLPKGIGNFSSSDPLKRLPYQNTAWHPTFVQLANGDVMPGLAPITLWGDPALPNTGKNDAKMDGYAFLAADADGDGTADSLLWKLPGTPIDGMTYYAAIRVIDHNSAVNVNTAWRWADGATGSQLERVSVPLAVPGSRPGTTPGFVNFTGIFPASVDLQELLMGRVGANRSTAIARLNSRRFNENGPAVDEGAINPTPWIDLPYSPSGSAMRERLDYQFLTPGDALWHQLGRQLDHPGRINSTAHYGYNRGRPYGLADQIALSYRFMLRTPDSGRTPLESKLDPLPDDREVQHMTGRQIQSTPKVQARLADRRDYITKEWFPTNFDYWPYDPDRKPNPSDYRPHRDLGTIRPLLTAMNPTRNYVHRLGTPMHLGVGPRDYGEPNMLMPALYYTSVMLRDDANQIGTLWGFPPNPDQRVSMWGGATKTNLNTAPFTELWRSFFDVMRDEERIDLAPFDDVDVTTPDPYYGQRFARVDSGASLSVLTEQNPARMFRSSLRPPGPTFDTSQANGRGQERDPAEKADEPAPFEPAPDEGEHRLTTYHMMMIRSALAALNTIDLRDVDNDLSVQILKFPAKNVTLAGGETPPFKEYAVMLFGTERQPFITEVYLNNNTYQVNVRGQTKQNSRGFAAIELHNPYEEPLSIEGWTIRLIDRNRYYPSLRFDGPPANANDEDKEKKRGWIGTNDPSNQEFRFPNNTVIPPRGYLILHNHSDTAGQNDKDAAQYTPGGLATTDLIVDDPDTKVGGRKNVYIKQLHKVIGREFVLMRPIYQDFGRDVIGPIAPVDSYDASGMVWRSGEPPAPDPSKPNSVWENVQAWHYTRASTDTSTPSRAWHFVYPGRYQADSPALGADERRHQGTHKTEWNPKSQGGAVPIEEAWSISSPTPPIQFGRPQKVGGHTREGSETPLPTPTSLIPTVASFPIQISNHEMPGPFSPTGDGNDKANRFPFGGFARAGDVMAVPYIGSYYVFNFANGYPFQPPNGEAGRDPASAWVSTLRFVECNAITMDSVFAEDTDPETDPFEDIGRFVPMMSLDTVDLRSRTVEGTLDDATSDMLWTPALFEPNGYWNDYDVIIYNSKYKPYPTDPQTGKRKATDDRRDFEKWQRQVRRIQDYKLVKRNDQNNNQVDMGEIKVDRNYPNLFPPEPGDTIRVVRSRYNWSSDILDYFTAIQSPADDFSPNINHYATNIPKYYYKNAAGDVLPVEATPEWGSNPSQTGPIPTRNVSDRGRKVNRDGVLNTPNEPTEDDVPSEGLININTAHWRVIATLPLVRNEDGTVNRVLTEQLAKNITYFRDVDDGMAPPLPPKIIYPMAFRPHPHGPFKSLLELNLVPGFMNAMGTLDDPDTWYINVRENPPDPGRLLSEKARRAHPNANQGDFSPMTSEGDSVRDGVRRDFEEKYLAVNRISNLITLRSDAYTCYIMVQGWRDADSPNAKLEIQRRGAFIVDRSRMNKFKKAPDVYTIPIN